MFRCDSKIHFMCVMHKLKRSSQLCMYVIQDEAMRSFETTETAPGNNIFEHRAHASTRLPHIQAPSCIFMICWVIGKVTEPYSPFKRL